MATERVEKAVCKLRLITDQLLQGPGLEPAQIIALTEIAVAKFEELRTVYLDTISNNAKHSAERLANERYCRDGAAERDNRDKGRESDSGEEGEKRGEAEAHSIEERESMEADGEETEKSTESCSEGEIMLEADGREETERRSGADCGEGEIVSEADGKEELEGEGDVEARVEGANLLVIQHEYEGGVPVLYPSKDQFQDFPSLLMCARQLGAESVGGCKVILPSPPDTRPQWSRAKLKGYNYSAERQDNGTFRIFREEGYTHTISGIDTEFSALMSDEVIRRFEALLEKGLEDVHYCTDISLRTERDRTRFGLPRSRIHPLKGNQLYRTRYEVPGIHWPYGYGSPGFGAPFSAHHEDFELLSVNDLWKGRKLWLLISPESKLKLESKLKDTNPRLYTMECAQFLRHESTFILLSTLKAWEIRYSILDQRSHEIIITFPNAYHQGFSVGYTLAEAVNYADTSWNIAKYRDCSDRCPSSTIPRYMMEFLSDGEIQQQSELSDYETEEAETTRNSRSTNGSLKKGPPKERRSGKESLKRKPAITGQQDYVKRLKCDFFTKELIADSEIQQVAGLFGQTQYPELLTRLYFAIASPAALAQLQESCKYSGVERLSYDTAVRNPFSALHQLELDEQTTAIGRRYLLWRLSLRYQEYKSEIEKQKRRPSKRKIPLKYSGETAVSGADVESPIGRTAQLAQGKLLDDSGIKRDSAKYGLALQQLKWWLKCSGNWVVLEQNFRPTILTLVHGISNNIVERIPHEDFQVFLKVLIRRRSRFLRQLAAAIPETIFEVMFGEDQSTQFGVARTVIDFNDCPFDSPELLKSCTLFFNS